jgi:hypothetical protein
MTTTHIIIKSENPQQYTFEVLDAWYGPNGKKYISVRSLNGKLFKGGPILKNLTEFGTLELISQEIENPPAG